MKRFIVSVQKFVREEDAPTFLEYSLTVALIAVVAITAVTFFGGRVLALHADSAAALQ